MSSYLELALEEHVEAKKREAAMSDDRGPIDRPFLVVVVVFAVFLISLGLAIYPH